MVAKRAYNVGRSACRPLPEQPPFTELPSHMASTNPGALERLAADSDYFVPFKPSTDVLVSGMARSLRGPVRCLDTGVRVGPLRKAVRVRGDRCIVIGAAGQLRFSEAEPFESLPLLWDHAYGGRDLHAEDKLHPRKSSFARRPAPSLGAIAYPRNPAGRGFFLDMDRERLHGARAPNLEDPEDPVTPERLLAKTSSDWSDRPVAACYAPVDWFSFPRVMLWLGVDYAHPARPLVELRRGALRPEDLIERTPGAPPDRRVYTCAPAGLSGARLSGGEPASVWNMHPRHEVWEFQLPRERPRLFVGPPGCSPFEVPAVLQTVLVEPEVDRVTLTWSGTLEVAAPYPDEMCRAMERVVRWDR
jgi:hypothetical protein